MKANSKVKTQNTKVGRPPKLDAVQKMTVLLAGRRAIGTVLCEAFRKRHLSDFRRAQVREQIGFLRLLKRFEREVWA